MRKTITATALVATGAGPAYFAGDHIGYERGKNTIEWAAQNAAYATGPRVDEFKKLAEKAGILIEMDRAEESE